MNLIYDAKAQSEAQSDAHYREKLERLRAEILVGMEQANRGEFVEYTAEDIISEARRR